MCACHAGEKEQREKKQKREEKKKNTQETMDIMSKLEIDTNNKKPAAVRSLHAPVQTKKLKRKGLRLRKNAIIRGIRIHDAESKRKVKELLAAEESMKEMMSDDGLQGHGVGQLAHGMSDE